MKWLFVLYLLIPFTHANTCATYSCPYGVENNDKACSGPCDESQCCLMPREDVLSHINRRLLKEEQDRVFMEINLTDPEFSDISSDIMANINSARARAMQEAIDTYELALEEQTDKENKALAVFINNNGVVPSLSRRRLSSLHDQSSETLLGISSYLMTEAVYIAIGVGSGVLGVGVPAAIMWKEAREARATRAANLANNLALSNPENPQRVSGLDTIRNKT